MRIHTSAALYLIVMIALIIAVDLLFFKSRFWARLAVNVAIVLIFMGCYYSFVKRT